MFRYNVSGNGNISLEELKTMMEKLKAPQTHLGLKSMIKEVDENEDGAISFREFLLIFRKSAAGELDQDSGLGQLATEIQVEEVGVGGAKNFFEAKVELLMIKFSFIVNFTKIAEANKGSKFEQEIREEQEERRREEEEKKSRQQLFRERAALFGGGS